jgi:glyoxylate utilization-related uncharacterized protein
MKTYDGTEFRVDGSQDGWAEVEWIDDEGCAYATGIAWVEAGAVFMPGDCESQPETALNERGEYVGDGNGVPQAEDQWVEATTGERAIVGLPGARLSIVQ